MSYSIDIYRQEMKPTKNFLDFALFVSFFPQLVAGPIERARHLLPQIIHHRKLTLEKFYEGCYLMTWGFFQKMVVADNLGAVLVDPVFASSPPYDSIDVLVATYAFAFQILCDFSGYSDIARGLAKCMGFDLMINFNLPYFATNPREFWKRWHISLSSWLRDYIYIPLGGKRKGKKLTYRNLAITMVLGGLWHGAAWTFVVWGIYNAFLLIIHRLSEPLLARIPKPKNFFLEKLSVFTRIVFFFHFICLGWLIFRAQSIEQVFQMLSSLTSYCPFLIMDYALRTFMTYTWLLLLVQCLCYRSKELCFILKIPVSLRALFYVMMYLSSILYGVQSDQAFIYFQF